MTSQECGFAPKVSDKKQNHTTNTNIKSVDLEFK